MAMARVDDLDGSPATVVTFGWDGKAYRIDLGAVNAEKFQAAIQPYLTVAQPYGDLPALDADQGPVLVQHPPVSASAGKPSAPAKTAAPVKAVKTASSVKTAKAVKGAAPRQRRVRKTAAAAAAAPSVNGNGKVAHSVIRKWAQDNGYSVTEKGRIPAQVLAAYEENHS